VVVNMGINSQVDKDTFKVLVEELGRITGQRPVVTLSRISIANFKLREGQPVGAKVTLRGARMYEFLERLIHAALPRIRDFRGVPPKGFDGRGSYTLGIKEQNIFPEIDPDHIKKVQGMDITVVTTAHTDEEARELLKRLGMPFAAA
jgi:large subunit ribosomal protein L5